jgi:hypothetical protein
LLQCGARFGDILLVVGEEGGALEQGARLFLGRLGRAEQGIEKLGQVPDRFSPLKQPDQPFERLAERRLHVEGGQVVACRSCLVATAFFGDGELVKQRRLLRGVVHGFALGPQEKSRGRIDDGGWRTRRVLARRGRYVGHALSGEARRARGAPGSNSTGLT